MCCKFALGTLRSCEIYDTLLYLTPHRASTLSESFGKVVKNVWIPWEANICKSFYVEEVLLLQYSYLLFY